jgi:hypothetical protein
VTALRSPCDLGIRKNKNPILIGKVEVQDEAWRQFRREGMEEARPPRQGKMKSY